MGTENKTCKQCGQQFTIQPEDFDFYKKINVPAPTWCPDCRMMRRFMFRNERSWYKRTCDATGKNILSMMAPDSGYTVYEQAYWRSDAWDPLEYGSDVDFDRPFLAQFGDLLKRIPHPNLIQKNNVTSDYTNCTLNLKNCYLCASTDTAEDCAYIFGIVLRAKYSFDLHQCTDTESSYQVVDSWKSNKLRFSQSCEGCVDSWLLYDCRNCTNCVGCVGLRSKQYHIFNEQYSKEDYYKKVAEMKLDTHQGVEAARKPFEELKLKVPRKYASIIKSEAAIGEDIQNAKNVRGFSIREGSENVRYSYRINSSKDIWDTFVAWNSAEIEYECMSCSAERISFSAYIWGGFDVQYSYNCFDCNNIFGCVGLRNKSYCILNKQYSKEEYEQLLPKVIEQMKAAPYKDKLGREFAYGEFFPPEIAPFSYNETVAQDYFPSTPAAAAAFGSPWRENATKSYQVSMKTEQIPDGIAQVDDAILNEVISCAHAGSSCNEQCAGAFKLIPLEVQFYKQMGIPLPRLCPSCRHFQRVKQKPAMKLYSGTCRCQSGHSHGTATCPNTFITPYAPDRPEKIYCEQCYTAEIA